MSERMRIRPLQTADRPAVERIHHGPDAAM
jgi:hypothetical protein